MTTTSTTLSPQAQTYLDAVNGGVQTLDVQWTSTAKPAAKSAGVALTKIVSAKVMTGVEYSGLRVNAGRETGSLPWGTWSAYPYLISHTGRDGIRRDYARLNTVEGTLRTTYLVDGRPVSREAYEAHLTPSARVVKRPHGGTITVKLDSLTIL